MTNLYLDTAEPAPPTPRLQGDHRTDVAIVGGGFTGLSAALHLAELGVQTTVLEAHAPGWGASGRNGGQVNPGLKLDPDEVERQHGGDLGQRMNRLAGGAPDFVFELIERHGIACEARRNGTLRAATDERHAAAVRVTAEQWQRRGAPVAILDSAAVAAATGTERYRLALIDRRGGDLNPLSFARGLARAALAAGAIVHGESRAVALEADADEWRVSTAMGIVRAKHVLIATNGYTDDLWPGLRRTLVPVFGSIAASEVLPAALARRIMPTRAVLYESGTVTVYYRVDGAGRLLIGGRGPQREVTHPEALDHLLRYARALWPALAGCTWTHAWSGRLAMTQDHYPHLHEPARGLSMCLGYNGRGVAMATRLGALMANRLAQPSGAFDMPVSTPKTIAMHALWPLAVRAVVARGRLSAWLGRS